MQLIWFLIQYNHVGVYNTTIRLILLRKSHTYFPNPSKTNAIPKVAQLESSWLIIVLDVTDGILQEDEFEMGPK